MKRLRAWSAFIVAGAISACGFGQNVDELQKQLNEMKATMQKQARALEAQGQAIEHLQTENASLKAQPERSGLETEINRLSERVAAGTNLRSCASAIKMGGEFRFRAYYAGIDAVTFDQTSDDFDGWWADQRVRLNFQYDFGCDVTAFAELQSRFAWGEAADGPFADWTHERRDEIPGGVGMYQAWLEFRNIFCHRELSARMGRQEVVLGNQFQFGNADWYNGIVHDGLRVDWNSSCWSLTLLALKLTTLDGDFNQIPSYFRAHDDDELYGAYFTLKSIKCATLDAYWLYVNGHGGFARNSGANFNQPSFLYPLAKAYFHTFGARLGGTLNVACGLDYNVEGAIQTGETHDVGISLDTDGFAVEGELGLTFNKKNRFRIFARGLYATGPDGGEDTGYLTLYPNRHSNTGFRARYGLADWIPMTNVITGQVGLHFDPACNWTVGATGLWATTEEDIIGLQGVNDGDYGVEVDVWAEYRYNAQITLGAGVAVIFPDDAGQAFWGIEDKTQFVGYVQARLLF